MRRIAASAIPLLALACLAHAVSLAAPLASFGEARVGHGRLDEAASMAFVAWNLGAGRGDLRRFTHDLQSGKLTDGSVPREFTLLLQEVVSPPSVAPYSFLAPVRTVGGHAVNTAILSTVPMLNPHAIELPRQRQPRVAAAATLEVSSLPLLVVSVHLENRGAGIWGGLTSEEARGRQAEALLAALPPDAYGVLGGDLNTWLGPTEPAWRGLVSRFPDLPPSRFDVTFRDRLPLDHVLFRLPEGWRAERLIVQDRYGSDHHPVIGRVWVPGTRADPLPLWLEPPVN